MGGYTIASNYPRAMAKCKIKALISYSKDTVKQPLLSLQRVAGLKVSKSVFMEMFSTETGGNGSSPPAVPRRCCNAVCKKPGPGAVPSALPSGQYLASQG